ncbi:phosphate/phosphite/phosphonate ABC transporter substrate-binding protein [Psychrobium sp. 1_MG-2023]|uniref:phosphate/phosphite/phosphonate ABC transporter substrate-binding protein n=1 Tax=Psychrobium sp. 1_MG-2023 TaxID=3062624 RepID=UPI000C31C6B6|nr:phosphate/phosphite/phosphonate ABC transporter substrate-binding protein [Psychrobium sp. 1_MG-2023]MDP2561700.1 phosphate/phosphite/phosphonate ABC transporter substrate-binding protein [Psychrobium sp. 1_MG-2023]PKF57101.1 phosphate-binding protein [Alteromonadales bacterium alter-6D02]
MNYPRYYLLLLAILFASLDASAKAFVIGKVSDNPQKHYGYLKPMADYLAKNLSEFGYTEGKVLMAKNNRQMVRYLKRKKVDLVTETIFSGVIFKDKAKAELLLTKWKKGQKNYESLIFVRKDSGINSLDDFKGKTIAFEDPGSTSAFYIPAAMLLRHGLSLERLDSVRDFPDEESVGYVFSNEEINTSTWVHKRLVQIGALNDHDWNKSDHLPKKFRDDFKIIAKSEKFPRGVELVRAGMSEALKRKIKSLLLNIHDDPDGVHILERYQKTARFQEFENNIGDVVKEARAIVSLVDSKLN